ncbi:MAG TPA: sulfotransferase [Anaerolineae bacterium]|nr:sulfotransferase [Anaerolineae bacterium]
MSSPIFISGTQRSGTSLLRSLIDSNTPIYMPPAEMKFFVRYHHKLARYEPLKPASIQQFIADYAQYRPVLHHTGVAQNSEMIATISQYDNWPSIYATLMLALAQTENKQWWGEKSPANEYFVDNILHFYPQSKILYTVRDPWAVVASSRRRYKQGFLRPTLRWVLSIRRALTYYNQLPKHTFHLVFYEDLVLNLHEALKPIWTFLGLSSADVAAKLTINQAKWGRGGVTSYKDRQEEQLVWEDSLIAYKRELTPREINIIGWLTRRERQLLGYQAEQAYTYGFSQQLQSKKDKSQLYYPHYLGHLLNGITDRPLRTPLTSSFT